MFQPPWDKQQFQGYLNVVIWTGHLRMVLNVKNVLKLQADHEALLQINGIRAFRALGVRVGVIRASDGAGSLGKEIATAFHCRKQNRENATSLAQTQPALDHLPLCNLYGVPRR